MSNILGLDIGSVSVKAVIMSKDISILNTYYIRNNGNPFKTVLKFLEDLNDYAIDKIAVTGSGGKLLAGFIDGRFANEVVALSTGVQYLYPHIRSAIEMGGQDSKFFLFDEGKDSREVYLKEFSMSSMCAAGTGSFLDQQASRLNVSIEDEFGRMALISKNPPRIAGRCSVFAKSDMIHLQQVGAPVHDIIGGLCHAVARSFKSNVCRGRELSLPVAFLGGVASNAGMVKAFEHIFKLKEGTLEIPPYHAHLPAIGAVCSVMKNYPSYKIKGIELKGLKDYTSSAYRHSTGLNRLFTRKSCNTYVKPVKGKQIPAYLGIDIGSLSTNLAVIDEKKDVIARRYLKTSGRPIETVLQGLEEIGNKVGGKVNICGVGTTGSGRYIIGELVGADVVKNEITAQATAAIHFDKDVDTIFEIGGQDSKYISIKDGVVVDFEMNKVCAAGTGSFIEEQAERLNVDIKGCFSDLAFKSSYPGLYGDRCTVFIESDLISAQQKGASKQDILAGLSYSIVNNYMNKVVGTKKVGSRLLFQGGVAWNKAVIAAFEQVTQKDIIVPPHHDITGAIGAALIARQEVSERRVKNTGFKGFFLKDIQYRVDVFECKSCDNVCSISTVKFGDDAPRFYGARCERFEKDKDRESSLPDLFAERDYMLYYPYTEPVKGGGVKRVGIPMALHLYEHFPYWNAFFSTLGFEVVSTGATSKKIIRDSIEQVKSELCFPAKVAHGHLMALLDMGLDYIFMPSIVNMEKGRHNYEENYTCPISQAIPCLIKSAVDMSNNKTEILSPALLFQVGRKEVLNTLAAMGKKIGKRRKDISTALEQAERAQRKFMSDARKRGAEILKSLDRFEHAAVLICRPYNGCDKGINLNIPQKLRSMGVVTLPIDFLPLEDKDMSADYPNMYWRSGQKMISAADIVKNYPKLDAIFLSNFGCGPDSFITYFLSEILKDKPFLQLEVDEHSADAGLITRCEAFFDSKKAAGNRPFIKRAKRVRKRAAGPSLKDKTVFLPYMGDQTYALSSAFRACGIDSAVLEKSDEEALRLGRSYVSGKECLPFIITLGDFVKRITKRSFDPERSVFFMPQTQGPCRFGQYNRLHQIIFQDLGYDNINILSPGTQDSYTNFGDVQKNFRRLSWKGIVAIDFIQKLLFRLRPYECEKGEADRAYKSSLSLILAEIEKGSVNFSSLLGKIEKTFSSINTIKGKRRPLIGIVGEIFVRSNDFSNNNIVHKIERAGGEVCIAPISEWVFYSTHCYKNRCKKYRDIKGFLAGSIQHIVQKRDEKCAEHVFSHLFNGEKELDVKEVVENGSCYLDPAVEGEAILSMGKAADFMKNGASGIVNVMPFTCMPGLIVTGLSKRFTDENHGVPWLNMTFDGQEDTLAATRIEAFLHQAEHFKSRRKDK